MYVFAQEDKPVIEAVQRSMGLSDLWSLQPVLLGCDTGAVQAWRSIALERIEGIGIRFERDL
jgi:Vanillate O-demethylase oxygenase C-terminal domain